MGHRRQGKSRQESLWGPENYYGLHSFSSESMWRKGVQRLKKSLAVADDVCDMPSTTLVSAQIACISFMSSFIVVVGVGGSRLSMLKMEKCTVWLMTPTQSSKGPSRAVAVGILWGHITTNWWQPTCCGQDRHCRAALRLRLPWGARHQHRHQHTRGSCSGCILVSIKGLLCIDEVRCWRSVCCYSLPTPQKNSVLGSIAVGTAIVKFCCEWQETRDGMGANLGRGNISVILLISFFNIGKDWLFCSALKKLTCSGLHQGHWNLKVVKAVRRWQ